MHFSLSLDVAEDHESGAERREITGAFGSRGMLSTAFGVFLFFFLAPGSFKVRFALPGKSFQTRAIPRPSLAKSPNYFPRQRDQRGQLTFKTARAVIGDYVFRNRLRLSGNAFVFTE